MNTFSKRNCLRHLEAVRFKDLCRYLRHMLKDYLIRFLPYYTRTLLKDITEVHCKQIFYNIMKIVLIIKVSLNLCNSYAYIIIIPKRTQYIIKPFIKNDVKQNLYKSK